MFNFIKKKPIGIGCEFDREDDRLVKLVPVHCTYVDRKGMIQKRTVMVTDAEKYVIESIAMRLFIDHRKVVKKEKTVDGKVRLVGRMTYELR